MSKYNLRPADPKDLNTYPLDSRKSKVGLEDFSSVIKTQGGISNFIDSLPNILAAKDFKAFLAAMRNARKEKKHILFGLGGHVFKVGLNPILQEMIKEGWITAIALNGAGIIHDFEIAHMGKTSEDVEAQLNEGRFGMAEDTGSFLNAAINSACKQNIGIGEAVGKNIHESDLKYRDKSLLAAAYEHNIPVTVHVAIGTDIIHFHPDVDGKNLGEASLRDFFLFCSLVEGLEGGVFCNIGSAVIIPEVFLKGVSFARNRGIPLKSFTTAVFDFNKHYRPEQNIVRRPVGRSGKGYYFIGHHELMIPLLFASLRSFRS